MPNVVGVKTPRGAVDVYAAPGSLARRDYLPPPLARMVALPTNPLTLLRHPVRTARAEWAAFGHPLRNRREMKAWKQDRRDDDRPA